MALRRSVGLLFRSVAVALALGAPSALAQQVRAVGVTPPRLSFVDGDVSYWRPGADDWAPAQINTALGAGDSLYAGDGGNLELELSARAYVRGGPGTQLGIESLEMGYLQLRVPAGYAAADLRRLPEGQEIEIDTPNGAFLIARPGYYRFDVDDRSTRFTVRRGGLGRVVPAGGNDEIEVGSSETVVVSGTDTGDLRRVAPAAEDAWDRWNYDRTAGLSAEPHSIQYVSPEVAGVDDLDRYGDWRPTPSYGQVWVPRDVASGWSPYTTGRWVWDGYYGWTWVDDAPWGWAPYHYGRWCWVDGYWGWAPGPVLARSVYSPALVAFFGSGGVSVSVGIGTPFVSWVPLGWGEPVVPWWGPRGFVGRPYWGGWGGPRVVNNTIINNTTIVNVNNLNRYENVRHRAVVGVDGNRFGRGRFETVRVDPDRVRNMRPVRGELGIRPVRESLVPREGRGQRPPERIQNRQVVATRAPQDPSRLPRSRGLIRETEAARRPEPRIVAPRGGGADRLERSGGRSQPPPLRGEVVERTRGGAERMPGRDRGEMLRGVPQAPDGNRRVPVERDRNRREIGKPIERRGPDGDVPPPARGSTAEPPPRPRGAGDLPAPPPAARERGGDRIEQRRAPRDPEGTRNDRSERMQQPAPPAGIRQPDRPSRDEALRPRNQAPRDAAPPRAGGDRSGERQRGIEPPRAERPIEQPRRMEGPPERPRQQAPSRDDRSPGRDAGGGGRESFQRQPAIPRQAVERTQRVEPPRQQPRVEAPRPQHQEVPRMERSGGTPRGGGSRDRGGRDRDG